MNSHRHLPIPPSQLLTATLVWDVYLCVCVCVCVREWVCEFLSPPNTLVSELQYLRSQERVNKPFSHLIEGSLMNSMEISDHSLPDECRAEDSVWVDGHTDRCDLRRTSGLEREMVSLQPTYQPAVFVSISALVFSTQGWICLTS